MKPIGANIKYRWSDGVGELSAYVSFGDHQDVEDGVDLFGVPDDDIFFYADGEQEMLERYRKSIDDWELIKYTLVYQD